MPALSWWNAGSSRTPGDLSGFLDEDFSSVRRWSESARRHAEPRAFIEAELERTESSGFTPVVITHHAPAPRYIRPWFEGSRLTPGFASDFDKVIARHQPPLWMHGHMHDRVDKRLGETRMVCNSGGYNRVEGHAFAPTFVVEV